MLEPRRPIAFRGIFARSHCTRSGVVLPDSDSTPFHWIKENPLAGIARGAHVCGMKGEFTAIIEAAPEGGYWSICPEVQGANGQGETIEEAKQSLKEAINLIFEDRVEDAKRGLPDDAIQTVVAI
jgi:predicted RNase H-like HicB family nuclease